jgi:hypothetical protein
MFSFSKSENDTLYKTKRVLLEAKEEETYSIRPKINTLLCFVGEINDTRKNTYTYFHIKIVPTYLHHVNRESQNDYLS